MTQLAVALGAHRRLESLAEYCRYRERGLRKQAFVALETFLQTSAEWDVDVARSQCRTILELQEVHGEAHHFLTHPLRTRFILPTLDSWLLECPDDRIPIRWVGILRRDLSLLQRALDLEPADVYVRRQVAGWFIAEVDYATHHLGEGTLLGELETIHSALDQARRVVEAAPDLRALVALAHEIQHYESLLRDWEDFSCAPVGTFPEWCANRGRSYGWPVIVYYEE